LPNAEQCSTSRSTSASETKAPCERSTPRSISPRGTVV
jgi:hypothetical protein